jgi:hypothetical protein
MKLLGGDDLDSRASAKGKLDTLRLSHEIKAGKPVRRVEVRHSNKVDVARGPFDLNAARVCVQLLAASISVGKHAGPGSQKVDALLKSSWKS